MAGQISARDMANNVKAEDGLLFGCLLDKKGGGTICDWETSGQWTDVDRPFWLHLDNESSRAEQWLREESGIPEAVVESLLMKESRPSSAVIDDGLLVILRGVNYNEGSEPEDMVAIRMWVEETRIITVRYERLMTPREVLADVLGNKGNLTDTPSLFVALAERLTGKVNEVIIELEDDISELEGRLDVDEPSVLRSKLASVRQNCVALRRYLSPQREALNNLQFEAPTWLDKSKLVRIRGMADQTMRYLEDLDAARDRALVVLDELSNKMAESMNRTMYSLSIVAAVFLPLGFLTGLLGINIGGMPGVDSDSAFWTFVIVLTVLTSIQIYVFRKLKWL